MLIPHHPYVFDSNGEELDTTTLELVDVSKNRDYNYLKQLQFTNKKILEVVDYILTNSKTPPIIVIQSDHGSTDSQKNTSPEDVINEAMHNLNVYYLPYGGESILYDGFSQVNSFRLIFNY